MSIHDNKTTDINIIKIKQAIPPECFKKDPLLGMHFIKFDYVCWLSTIMFYYNIENKTFLIKTLLISWEEG
ncbi:hypothetical protein EBR57_10840, partial [bacterium]|nr:hypothetical protein [bacterium]